MESSSHWKAVFRQHLGWIAAGALAVVAYRELLWTQPEHALPEELERWFFVPSESLTPAVIALALWLLYRRIPRLRAVPADPGSRGVGFGLLGAALVVYLWSTYTGANDLLVPSLMLTGAASAWLWRGRPALRAVFLPLAFLVFAMPLPAPLLNEVIFLLQLGTTELAGFMLYVLEIPHLVSGERIVRPGDTFSVIESCSGLRSMEILTIMAILMADLFRRRGVHAWILVMTAPVVAFFLNGLRAVLLILNPHSEIAAVHNLQGVAILLGGLFLLFLLDGLLEWGPFGLASHAEPEPAAARWGGGADATSRVVAAAMGAAVLASLAMPRWEATDPPSLEALRRTSRHIGTLRARPLTTDRLFLGSTGFSESFTLRVEEPGKEPVVLFLGVGDRTARHRSPLSPKTALPGSGWIVEERFPVDLGEAEGEAEGRILRSGSTRVLVYSWTRGAGSWLEEVVRSFLALDRSFLRRSSEVLVVRIGAALSSAPGGKMKAEQRLVSFSRTLRPLLDELQATLEKTFSGFS
ncbi:MAG: exosortase/archaeosortase family protein [Myxococcota bacterium]|nr:exosortase/archaeosortase family protein [Myxococcota bacterium]